MRHLSTVERAFEIAQDRKCRDLSDIRRQLLAEGYTSVQSHLAGSSIRRQLLALLKQDAGGQRFATKSETPL